MSLGRRAKDVIYLEVLYKRIKGHIFTNIWFLYFDVIIYHDVKYLAVVSCCVGQGEKFVESLLTDHMAGVSASLPDR